VKAVGEAGGVVKRFFPVIFKPVLLILLFLVAVAWVYHVHVAVLDMELIIPIDIPLELRALERDRLSSFGSFLINVFTGNFGVSSMSRMSVSVELAWRLPITLLLIGVSIVFSLLIGVGFAALLAVMAKRGRRRPSTFAHSLGGFFFGATPLVAFIIAFFFCYYVSVAWGLRIFPVRGMYSTPPPTDPVAYIADVAWHLTLPVAALVWVNVVRTPLIIWSSGSPFTTKRLLKRLLLPITTIDFISTISAVIFVEYIFTLPGIGSWFLRSLMAGDFPVVMGAFVVFVAIAVGLGFVSVLLDFIQRLVGLRNDLDTKSEAQPKLNEGPTSFFKNYLKPFLRKKSLMIGLPIVIVFLAFALFAPWLTPYDPIAQPRLAESMAMPEWVRIFPQFQDLTTTQRNELSWDPELGLKYVEGWGRIIEIHYEAETLQAAPVELRSKFSYTAAPPNEFVTRFRFEAIDVSGTEYSLMMSILTPGGDSYLFYKSFTFTEVQGQDVTMDSKDPLVLATLGFEANENVANMLFSQKGEYTLVLAVQFQPFSRSATAQIKVQDSTLIIFGQVHGILGTDYVAKDVFSQMVYGARTIVIFVFPFAFLAVMLGLPLGFLSGYFQGWTDNVIAPIVETFRYLPILPILLVNVYLLGRSEISILAFSLLFLFAPATMAFRNMFLVRPATQKFTGNTPAKQVVNVLKDLFSNLCLTSISLMLLLLGIDFLGFGNPRVPSWGMMLQRAFAFGGFVSLAWWWIVPPIICFVLLALGLLLVGAGLEDVSF
jgi:ABC-type dipeptide/oligopeptide/nickel transport system permease subunit/ABC-type microcin C transport system permease subunit YejB